MGNLLATGFVFGHSNPLQFLEVLHAVPYGTPAEPHLQDRYAADDLERLHASAYARTVLALGGHCSA